MNERIKLDRADQDPTKSQIKISTEAMKAVTGADIPVTDHVVGDELFVAIREAQAVVDTDIYEGGSK